MPRWYLRLATGYPNMAHKKAGGSTTLGRDSHGQRLGVKLTTGSYAKPGAIIVRQRGTRYRAGLGVMRGKDDTLFASMAGLVRFVSKTRDRFDGSRRQVKVVSVEAQKK